MTGFIAALIKQRKEAKKAEPNSNGRLREILAVLKKYNYDDGITPGAIALRGIGMAGYLVSLFFAQRLIRNMMKGK